MLRNIIIESLAIWTITLVGGLITWIIILGSFPPIAVAVLPALLSVPALMLLVPSLYMMHWIGEPFNRILFSLLCTTTLSTIAFCIACALLEVSPIDLIIGMLPYIIIAPFAFILVAECSIIIRHKLPDVPNHHYQKNS
jgi:hypothetical protein